MNGDDLRRIDSAVRIARDYISDDDDSPGDRSDYRRARAVLATSLESIGSEKPDPLPEPVRQAAIVLATSWVFDRDVNTERGTDQALLVLNEWFELRTTTDAEALAAAADIHRARWELSAQWRELRRALYLYERARRGRWGPDSDELLDLARIELHAAFLLDTLARQEERSLHREDATWAQRVPVVDDHLEDGDTAPTELGSTAPTFRRDAEKLRDGVVARLQSAEREMLDRGHAADEHDPDGRDERRRVWTYYLLLAEAHVGLRDYAAATSAITTGAEWEPPNSDMPLQLAAKRLIELARMRGIRPAADDTADQFEMADHDLEHALEMHKQGAPYSRIATELRLESGDAAREAVIAAARIQSRRVVEALLGVSDADRIDSAFKGKLGLALSGGGFRASLFHIGVLAQLAEQGLLPEVQAISCVSGGSILGAQYYLLVQQLLESHTDEQLKKNDSDAHYIGIVQELVERYETIIHKNMRARIFANPLATAGLWPSPSRRVGKLVHRHLLPPASDPATGEPRHDLRDIKIAPKDWPPDREFKPKHHNWQRKHKVPLLILNATSLNTGHNWQFSAVHVGEPPSLIHSDIDSGAHLARLRLTTPQGFRFLSSRRAKEAAAVPITLGEAVAASAAVPGLFQPLTVTGLYPDWLIKLADGGVVDNQGIGSLLEQGSDTMFISDASRQLASSPAPAGGLSPALRSNSIAYHRIRAAQYDELRTRRRSGLVRDVMFVHLNRDLEGPRIKPRAAAGADDGDRHPASEPPTTTKRIRTKRAARGLRPPDWTHQMVLKVLLEQSDAIRLDQITAAIPGVSAGAVGRAVGSLVARSLVDHLPESQTYRITHTGRRQAETSTTSYRIARSIQNNLARTRTDLNAFTQAEAYALMTSGYLMTRHALRERNGIGPYRPKTADEDLDVARWKFLRIAKVMGEPDAALARYQYRLERHLAGGRRAVRLPSNVSIGSLAAAAVVAIAALTLLGAASPLSWIGEVVALGAYNVPVPRLLIAALLGLTLLGVLVMLWTRISGRPPTRPFAVLAKASFLPVGLVLAVGSWLALILGSLTPARGSVDSFLPPEDRQRWSLAVHLPNRPPRAATPS